MDNPNALKDEENMGNFQWESQKGCEGSWKFTFLWWEENETGSTDTEENDQNENDNPPDQPPEESETKVVKIELTAKLKQPVCNPMAASFRSLVESASSTSSAFI
eukprot:2837385-Amphidinium_carterae.1